jgi:hypothetical protein
MTSYKGKLPIFLCCRQDWKAGISERLLKSMAVGMDGGVGWEVDV